MNQASGCLVAGGGGDQLSVLSVQLRWESVRCGRPAVRLQHNNISSLQHSRSCGCLNNKKQPPPTPGCQCSCFPWLCLGWAGRMLVPIMSSRSNADHQSPAQPPIVRHRQIDSSHYPALSSHCTLHHGKHRSNCPSDNKDGVVSAWSFYTWRRPNNFHVISTIEYE